MDPYNHKTIEKKWQKFWKDNQTYKTSDDSSKPKQFIADMFPYPSGNSMHVGHPRGYVATDVYSRFKRMSGFNVLHPMGWDAFGLPAENFAIKNKIHPREAVEENIAKFKSQLEMIGFDYDWSREINTTDPEYYKWTQWSFIQMYKKGLAFESFEPINWCPSCQTGLANEDVESDGTCERCGTKVEKRPMRQWVLKITDYADRLLADLDKLPKWPEGVKEAQRHWIGRSEGSEIEFAVIPAKAGIQDSLKFSPEWKERIVNGTKTDTVRYEKKNLKEGDFAEMITRFDETSTRSFGVAKITKVETMLLREIPLDRKSGNTYKDHSEMLKKYQDRYGNEVALDSEFTIYHFEMVTVPIKIFTTRADTLFGVTYVVLAPEHPLIQKLEDKIQNYEEVSNYVSSVKEKTDIDRTNAKKEKTGVKLEGIFATNPANGEQVPVWVADYVLANHGTGAVMAVPAHDERDFEFANKYGLPIKQVIVPVDSFKSIVVAPTLDNDIAFKEELQKRGINFTLSISTISKREHIRVEFKKENLQKFIDLVQKHITGTNWVEILGSENIVVRKDSIHKDFLNQSDEWFKKFMEWEPLIQGQKSLWDMLGKNSFLNDFVCYRDNGILRNSQNFDGMNIEEAKKAITEFVGGKLVTNYRMKDWVFSRQRYWGEPIPIIHCSKCGPVTVPESDLPVKLPDVTHYEPTGTGESPLAAIDAWVNTTCPTCGGVAKRETNTMPQWAGSSWYYLRYIDPRNNDALVDPAKEKHWMPVDVYAGADHATRHLIYARFWHKFLFDIGAVSTDEPFPRLEFLGYILDKNGKKFSKRDGNGIDPADVVNQFGADAFRLYEMFIGPFEQTARWDTNGMVGTYRFIEKVWRIAEKIQNSQTETNEVIRKTLHKTIKKVNEDIEAFKFNTAISSLMILANEIDSTYQVSIDDFKSFLKITAPFAPHVTEELWNMLGETESIHLSDWPTFDPNLIVDDTITLGVQVNGKVRAEITLGMSEEESSVKEKVFALPEVIKWLDGKEPKKFIYIPGKIISIVV